MNSYWLKKEDDLELKLLINSKITNKRYKSTGEGTETIFTHEASVQFPESEENSVENLLRKQREELEEEFGKERSGMQQKMREYELKVGEEKQKISELNEKIKQLS